MSRFLKKSLNELSISGIDAVHGRENKLIFYNSLRVKGQVEGPDTANFRNKTTASLL